MNLVQFCSLNYFILSLTICEVYQEGSLYVGNILFQEPSSVPVEVLGVGGGRIAEVVVLPHFLNNAEAEL